MIDGNIKNVKNPDQLLFTEKQWRLILNLECTHSNFEGIVDSMMKNLPEWRKWIKEKEIEKFDVPCGWEQKLSRFQRMLVYKAVRDEKLVFKMREFVEKELGHMFAHPLPVRMEEVYNDSDNKTPVIFILSTGAEPTS